MPKLLVRTMILAVAFLASGCVTSMTQDAVRLRIEDAAGKTTAKNGQRVYPIYAETKLVAWTKLTEAERQPNVGPSAQLALRLKRAASREQRVVVGGPYPQLTDRVLANALAANRDVNLSGLTIVFVSAVGPSSALSQEAQNSRARIVHREF